MWVLAVVVAALLGLLAGWVLWRWRKGPGGRARALRASLDTTTASLAARTHDVEVVRSELAIATTTLDEAKAFADALGEANGRLTAERDMLVAERIRLEQTIRQLEAAQRSSTTALADSGIRTARAEATAAALRAEALAAGGTIRVATAERDAAPAAMSRLRSARDGLRATLAAAQERELAAPHRQQLVGTTCGQRGALRAELDALRGERNLLASDLEAARAALLARLDASTPVPVPAPGAVELPDRGAGEGPVPDSALTGDDLKAIPGVGPVLESLLKANGVRTYAQLARIDDAGLDRLDRAVPGIAERARRDAWVAEAARLASSAGS